MHPAFAPTETQNQNRVPANPVGRPGRRAELANVRMKVGLFIPCYIDAFFPDVGVASLEGLGCSVVPARPASRKSAGVTRRTRAARRRATAV